MTNKGFRFSCMLKGLAGGVILLASSGAYLYNATAWAQDADQFSGEFQHTLVNYHESELNGAKPILWTGEYGELVSENVAIQESSVNDLTGRSTSNMEAGIGMGVTPLFDSYGVLRTGSNNNQSTYAVLGFLADEMILDDPDTVESDNDVKLSYGFGVNKSSFNFEYMMAVDEGRRDISAIGMRFTSTFK